MSQVFELLLKDSSLVSKVQRNTTRFRTAMTAVGFHVGGDPQHAICPIHLGDARLAAEFADAMLDKGVYVVGFSFPVVAKGKARIRVQISAGHSEVGHGPRARRAQTPVSLTQPLAFSLSPSLQADIDHAVQAFVDVGRAKKVIA